MDGFLFVLSIIFLMLAILLESVRFIIAVIITCITASIINHYSVEEQAEIKINYKIDLLKSGEIEITNKYNNTNIIELDSLEEYILKDNL